jgi:putative flippase GtrA
MTGTLIVRNHILQLIKFSVVGALNTAIGLAVFYLFYFIGGLHYSLALALSYGVGIINSYVWNRQWTFSSKGKIYHEAWKFALVYINSYAINLLLMFYFVEKAGIATEISVVITLILTTIISFAGHKWWSFRKVN